MVLPAVLVVDDGLRVPLRKGEPPPLAPLPPRQRGRASGPADLDLHRVAGRERPRQRPVRDRRVGRVRVIRLQALPHDAGGADPLERVIRILHVLKAHAPLGRIGRGPARPRPKRVEVLVDVEVVQRVGRLIHVADALVRRQDAGRLVERRGDLIRNALLPVRRVAWRGEQEQQGEHGLGNLAQFGPGSQGKDDGSDARRGTMVLHLFLEDLCGSVQRSSRPSCSPRPARTAPSRRRPRCPWRRRPSPRPTVCPSSWPDSWRRGHNGSSAVLGGLMWKSTTIITAGLITPTCSARAIAPPPEIPLAAPPVATSDRLPVELARLVARGLKNPAFRAYLKAQLAAS